MSHVSWFAAYHVGFIPALKREAFSSHLHNHYDRLIPAHGPDLSGADVRSALRRLIDRRLDRERRVRVAVDGGAQTVEEIRDRAYDRDLSGVRDLADATVRAHLEKLAVEGRVRWDGQRAHPTNG